jgi:hypothetical protein
MQASKTTNRGYRGNHFRGLAVTHWLPILRELWELGPDIEHAKERVRVMQATKRGMWESD